MTTPESNSVGLIAWGMKLGIQIFFNSPNLNPGSGDISDTLEDIRGLVRINHANQIFYSLDFTSDNKVVTLYKTIHDWDNRVNAYLALSLFVPFSYDPKFRPRKVLHDLLAIYDNNYIDEGMRIKKIPREDPNLFFEKLPKPLATLKESTFSRPTNANDRNYGYIRYHSDETLDEYFANPYLSAYRDNKIKEVFFIPANNDKLAPNDQLINLDDVRPEPLYYELNFSFKDNHGNRLNPPFECIIDKKNFNDRPDLQVKVGVDINEVSIVINKQGFKYYSESLSIQDYFSKAQNGSYYLQLAAELYTLTLRVKRRNPNNPNEIWPVSNASLRGSVKNNTGNDRIIIDKTNDQGQVTISGLLYGDSVNVNISKDGCEDKLYSKSYIEKNEVDEIIIQTIMPLSNIIPSHQPPTANPQQTGSNEPNSTGNSNPTEPGSGGAETSGGQTNTLESKKSYFSKTNLVTVAIVLVVIIVAIVVVWMISKHINRNDELNKLKAELTVQVDSLTNADYYSGFSELDTLLERQFDALEQRIASKAPQLNAFGIEIQQYKENQKKINLALRVDTLNAINSQFQKEIDELKLQDSKKLLLRITDESKKRINNLILVRKKAIRDDAQTIEAKMDNALGKAEKQVEEDRLQKLRNDIQALYDTRNWKNIDTGKYSTAVDKLNANPGLFGDKHDNYLERLKALKKARENLYNISNNNPGSQKHADAIRNLEGLQTNRSLSREQQNIINEVLQGNTN